jgi:hypothetical protein
MTSSKRGQWARLLKEVREECIGLLTIRYIFRTIQEILRRNPRVLDYPGTFNQWTWVMYAMSNTAGIRRLAGQSPDVSDVSLVCLLDEMLKYADELWVPFQSHYPAELAEAHSKALARGSLDAKAEACRRLVAADRKTLIGQTDKASHFANKRVAHRNHVVEVKTSFKDLDQGLNIIKTLTQKYLLLVYGRAFDLDQEMKSHQLPMGWADIFLIPWATADILALPLGDMLPAPPARSPRP